MAENQDLAPVVENDEPIVQEQEDERVADIEKPKKQKRPYIMTEARKSAFERMKQLRADSIASKRAVKEQTEEKQAEERPAEPSAEPCAPKEKKNSVNLVHHENVKHLLQKKNLYPFHL